MRRVRPAVHRLDTAPAGRSTASTPRRPGGPPPRHRAGRAVHRLDTAPAGRSTAPAVHDT